MFTRAAHFDILSVVLCALLLALQLGCGNYCDRAESSSKSVVDKARNCRLTVRVVSKGTCDRIIPSCTDGDIKLMNQMLDCTDRVPACTAGQEAGFSAALASCRSLSASLGRSCLEAMSRESL